MLPDSIPDPLVAPRPQEQPADPSASSAGAPERWGRRGVVRGHVVAAVRVLRERIADSWTLQGLAEEVHLSRSQLSRSFDAAVGKSPMAYLRLMRGEGFVPGETVLVAVIVTSTHADPDGTASVTHRPRAPWRAGEMVLLGSASGTTVRGGVPARPTRWWR